MYKGYLSFFPWLYFIEIMKNTKKLWKVLRSHEKYYKLLKAEKFFLNDFFNYFSFLLKIDSCTHYNGSPVSVSRPVPFQKKKKNQKIWQLKVVRYKYFGVA